jgi:uncharacterized protein YqjF (DUF2071 family)
MKNPSDLAPTEPLRGFHMKGVVTRRFLITYAVPPETLRTAVPPGGELVLHNGLAWVSACFVHIAGMRPSGVPGWLGINFNYLIHRTLARLPYPDGKLRNTVLVLEANINRPVLGAIARKMTGVRFHIRDISLTDLADSWIVRMTERDDVVYEAEIYKRSIGEETDHRSQFKSATEADRFLLGISFGAQWEPEARQIKLLAETHDPWKTYVGQCTTNRHALLISLGVQQISADHVITMTDIPHYFALRGLVVPCPELSSV